MELVSPDDFTVRERELMQLFDTKTNVISSHCFGQHCMILGKKIWFTNINPFVVCSWIVVHTQVGYYLATCIVLKLFPQCT